MPKEVSIEEMVKIVEGFGWDYAESSDGNGDMFAYWDHLNGDMPDWAGENMTSCECLETIYDLYVNRLDSKQQALDITQTEIDQAQAKINKARKLNRYYAGNQKGRFRKRIKRRVRNNDKPNTTIIT